MKRLVVNDNLIDRLRKYTYWCGGDIHPNICDEAATAIEINNIQMGKMGSKLDRRGDIIDSLETELSEKIAQINDLKNKIKKMHPVYDHCMDCPIVCVKDDYLKTKDENTELKELMRLAVDGMNCIADEIRDSDHDTGCCGLCEYDGAYMGESGDWCNECPGFNETYCFKWKHADRMGKLMGSTKGEGE